MAEICLKMAKSGVSSAKEARRRRTEMRRFSSLSGSPSLPQTSDPNRRANRQEEEPDLVTSEGKRNRSTGSNTISSSSSKGEAESQPGPSTSVQGASIDPAPNFGSLSVAGRSREMEDAITMQPDFFRPDVPRRPPLHFFGVFDGHGGSHVAILCKELMHVFLAEELTRVLDSGDDDVSESVQDLSPVGWNSAMVSCFKKMDDVALSSCACGAVGATCGCDRVGITSDIVGSTAVIAVVGIDRIVVANCGDSRAVLSRGGRAMPLSDDHKPDRPDELARIEAAGGRVIYLNGARVLGILAMSRAIGDRYLKPIVISEPDVNVTERTADDELLILASDGLWDVLSNDLACDIARRCLHEGPSSTAEETPDPTSAGRSVNGDDDAVRSTRSRCSLAAALLTRLALGRKSSDNISVIVVDLKTG